jgi:hypothetical protein
MKLRLPPLHQQWLSKSEFTELKSITRKSTRNLRDETAEARYFYGSGNTMRVTHMLKNEKFIDLLFVILITVNPSKIEDGIYVVHPTEPGIFALPIV